MRHMITCGTCSTINSERRKFCSDCGALIVSFCKKCGFNNLVSDKYCGGCGVTMTARSEAPLAEAHEEAVGGRYSAAEIKELTGLRSEVKNSKAKKKTDADEEQMSQDAVNEMFNSRNEE